MARILVAEDEAALRGQILRALTAAGHDAVAAVDVRGEPHAQIADLGARRSGEQHVDQVSDARRALHDDAVPQPRPPRRLGIEVDGVRVGE